LLLLRWGGKRPAANETVSESQALVVKALAIQADSAGAKAVIIAVERTFR